MNVNSMIDEVNNIRQLVEAYEYLNDLLYEDAAECAFEALKSQVSTLVQVLEEEAAR
jgi:hypothetical protein